MVFSYYGGFGQTEDCFLLNGQKFCRPGPVPSSGTSSRQVDSAAVTQLTDAELLGALAALAAGQGYPPRGATAADLRAAANLLIGEAIKRRLPVPAKLAGGSVADTSAPNMDAVRAHQEQMIRARLSSIPTEDLVGILKAIDTKQPFYKDSRLESLAPFRALFAEELARRTVSVDQGVTALPLPTASTSAASTAAPEKSNTGLLLGGLAVVAAIFLLKK